MCIQLIDIVIHDFLILCPKPENDFLLFLFGDEAIFTAIIQERVLGDNVQDMFVSDC
jgi:hypothetical protein